MKPRYGIVLAMLVAASPVFAQALPTLPTERLPLVPPPEALPAPKPLPEPKPTPSSARFALLKDQRVFEGEVAIALETITIRRGAIDHVFPKGDVLFIGTSREALYQHQRKTVGSNDLEGRLKLAKWCAYSGMREQALAEARAAALLDPKNSTAQQMIRSLEESLRRFPPAGTQTAPATIPPSLAVKSVPTTPVPAVVVPESEIPAAITLAFRTRVQPVLTNLCAGCHTRPDMTGFRLAKLLEWDTNTAATQQNMRAVLAHVRKENPASSAFLVIALSQHGGMKEPAFASEKAPAYRALVEWVMAAGDYATPVKLRSPPEPELPKASAESLVPRMPPLSPKEKRQSNAPGVVPLLPPVSAPLLPPSPPPPQPVAVTPTLPALAPPVLAPSKPPAVPEPVITMPAMPRPVAAPMDPPVAPVIVPSMPVPQVNPPPVPPRPVAPVIIPSMPVPQVNPPRPVITPTAPALPPPAAAPKLPQVPPPPGLSKSPPQDIVLPILSVTFASDKVVEAPTGPSPSNTGVPVDEFDPSLFNRMVHPAAGDSKK